MITVMQVCGGKNPGGAEAHFLRFCIELEKFENIRVVPVVRKGSWLESQFRELQITCYSLPFLGRYDLWTRYQLKTIAAKTQAKIAQCWMSRAASSMPKVRSTVNIGRLGGYYALKNFQSMDWLVGATNDLRRHIIEGGHSADQTAVIPNFVNPPKPEVPADTARLTIELGLQNKQVLFTPARLHPVKGLDLALTALSNLPDQYCYVIAGQGPEEAELKQQAKELGIADRVKFVGWTDNISQYCYLSDVFLVPSNHEPFGSVLLEAWSHRLPLISSDSEGAQAITTADKNALIFKRGDSDGLKKQILALFSDPTLRAKLIEQGFEEYQSQYTARSVLSRYVELYQRLSS